MYHNFPSRGYELQKMQFLQKKRPILKENSQTKMTMTQQKIIGFEKIER